MANNFFTLCSFFYSILLNIIFFSKPRIKTLETKIYQYMIISNLCTVTLAVISFFTILNCDKIPIINDIISKLLLIALFFWGLLFAIYIVSITFSKKILKKLYNDIAIAVFLDVCIIFCVFT